MKNYFPILGLAIILFSCEQNKDKVNELEAKVLMVHDDIMPRMDEIMTLKLKISKKITQIDSLQNEGVSGNNLAEQRIKATDINQKLNESDKLMMGWMNEYRGDSAKKLKPEQAIAYFEKEQKKIEEVKQTTIKNINDANAFLEN